MTCLCCGQDMFLRDSSASRIEYDCLHCNYNVYSVNVGEVHLVPRATRSQGRAEITILYEHSNADTMRRQLAEAVLAFRRQSAGR
jgi:hypothetical protein